MRGHAPPREEQDVLAAVVPMLKAAAGSADYRRVASIATRRLQRLLQCEVAAIFLRRRSDLYDYVAAAGPRARAARQAWRAGITVPGRLLSAATLPALPGLKPPVLVPLQVRGHLVGALAIVPTTWDARCRRLARRAAAHIATPLEHTLLAAALAIAARTAAQTTDLNGILRAILAGLRRVVPADAAGILIREGDYARAIALDGHPEDALGALMPISPEMDLDGPLLRGEAVRVDDPAWGRYEDIPAGAERVRSYLAVPLTAGKAIIGVLCLDGWRSGAFDDEDLRRACQFAAHAATAPVHARTYSLTLAEAATLREAALLATHDPHAGDIVHRILDGVRRVVTCDGASVLLREGTYARVVATHGHPDSVLGHRFLITGSPAFEATLVAGRPYHSPDLSAEPDFVAVPGVKRIRGHLSVPLLARGEILGLVSIDSLRRGAFGPEDAARLELFAGYVASALLNARLHSAIREAAERDPVTSLFNHRAIHDHLDRQLDQARLADTPLAVAMLDLDGFKRYNDTHGHPAGDDALRAIAGALLAACRSCDLVGRYGGDEFLVILPGLAAPDAAEFGARLREAVATRAFHPVQGHALPLRVSVGISLFPQDGTTRGELVRCADVRLYQSKRRGWVVAPSVAGAHALSG